jgi:hypothetical protein
MKKLIFGLVLSAAVGLTSVAAQTVIVTPSNTQGWSTEDTRPGGTVEINGDQPYAGNGSLNLTTDATTTAKAQYMHQANTAFGSISELSYSTYQASASFAGGDASYQLVACLGGLDAGGNCIGFTTLVYEPYQNGVVIPGTWQDWDVDAGQFWSSRSYSSGTCTVVAGGGGAPFYTLGGLTASCPNAIAVGFGVNIGSNNPSYDVFADLVNFDGTTYNFELFEVAQTSGQCKNGGWMTLFRANGSSFKNQGDCVSYTNNGK